MDAPVTEARRPGSLRLKLVAAFVLVTVPPLVLLAGAVTILVGEAFETAVSRRLEQGLRATQRRIDSLAQRAKDEVEDIAVGLPLEPPGDAAARLAERHRLEVLELLDADDRVLSSRHWPAGFGLPDRDRTFAGPEAAAVRLEMTAEDYGAAERLTLTATRSAVWGRQPVRVRGGFLLDEAFWTELSEGLGLEAGIWDAQRRPGRQRRSRAASGTPSPAACAS